MIDNFWRDLPRPFFVLAPMEDVTDVVFRHVVSEAGRPDVFLLSLQIRIATVIQRERKVCVAVCSLQKMSSQWWHIFGR